LKNQEPLGASTIVPTSLQPVCGVEAGAPGICIEVKVPPTSTRVTFNPFTERVARTGGDDGDWICPSQRLMLSSTPPPFPAPNVMTEHSPSSLSFGACGTVYSAARMADDGVRRCQRDGASQVSARSAVAGADAAGAADAEVGPEDAEGAGAGGAGSAGDREHPARVTARRSR
jgi:hypothetical protein